MRAVIAALFVIAVAMMSASPVVATHTPHFVEEETSASVNADGNLVVTFTVVGRHRDPNERVAYYSAQATRHEVYACINRGGHHVAPFRAEYSQFVGMTLGNLPLATGTLEYDFAHIARAEHTCPRGLQAAVLATYYTDVIFSTQGALIEFDSVYPESS